MRPTSRYGEMRVSGDARRRVQREAAAPRASSSGGFFVFQREFFDYLTTIPGLFFEHAPLQTLARDGELAVFPHDGFWMGMDTYRELHRAQRAVGERRRAVEGVERRAEVSHGV